MPEQEPFQPNPIVFLDIKIGREDGELKSSLQSPLK